MFSIHEMQRSLTGAWLLFTGKPEGLNSFDGSADAFWRSFLAILIIAPLFALSLPIQYDLFLQKTNSTPADVPYGRFSAIQILYLCADWVTFPIVMIFLAKLLNVTHAYGRYITILNWSSVMLIAFSAIPVAGYLTGVTGLNGIEAFRLPLLLAHLWQRWFLARAALNVSGFTATFLVVVELTVSLILVGLTHQASLPG